MVLCDPELESLAAAGGSNLPYSSAHRGDDAEALTYEELCRAHIDAFINAAATAEVQTELASRCWQSNAAAFAALAMSASRSLLAFAALVRSSTDLMIAQSASVQP